MKKVFLISVLIFYGVSVALSQIVTKSINDEIKRLPKFSNLNVVVVKKNGKPFKEVEITLILAKINLPFPILVG